MNVVPSRVRRSGRCGIGGAAAVLALAIAPGGGAAAARVALAPQRSSAGRCAATRVHYTPYRGAEPGLAGLPWIAASPRSSALVGHLFYYDRLNVWRRRRLRGARIYTGGQSPHGRVGMKILWELRRGSALILRVQGRRLDGRGSFSQELPPAGSTQFQFPSIIVVPTPGCWRLTLQAGTATGRVTMLAVPGKAS